MLKFSSGELNCFRPLNTADVRVWDKVNLQQILIKIVYYPKHHINSTSKNHFLPLWCLFILVVSLYQLGFVWTLAYRVIFSLAAGSSLPEFSLPPVAILRHWMSVTLAEIATLSHVSRRSDFRFRWLFYLHSRNTNTGDIISRRSCRINNTITNVEPKIWHQHRHRNQFKLESASS